jgi:hypothetical protein
MPSRRARRTNGRSRRPASGGVVTPSCFFSRAPRSAAVHDRGERSGDVERQIRSPQEQKGGRSLQHACVPRSGTVDTGDWGPALRRRVCLRHVRAIRARAERPVLASPPPAIRGSFAVASRASGGFGATRPRVRGGDVPAGCLGRPPGSAGRASSQRAPGRDGGRGRGRQLRRAGVQRCGRGRGPSVAFRTCAAG